MKRKKILEAASVVFSQKGFHKAQMDEIAALANVAKGTLYYQFSSKSNLFAATVIEGFETIHKGIREELKSDLPFIEHFYRILRKTVLLYLKHADLARIYFNEMTSGLDKEVIEEIEKVKEAFINFLVELVREGQDKGYLKPTNPKLTAVALAALVDGLSNHHMKNGKAAEPDAVIETIFIILSSGLVKRT